MLIEALEIKNLLSFGPDTENLTLGPLNVLIGPNGSGKSNLLEVIGLLKAAPGELTRPVREGGGIREWLWKGSESTYITASIKATIRGRHWVREDIFPGASLPLIHYLSFYDSGGGLLKITRESLKYDNEEKDGGFDLYGREKPFYEYKSGHRAKILTKSEKGGISRFIDEDKINREKSILAQRKDPDQYPDLTDLGDRYEKIRLYREWQFGRYTPPRLPQKADLPNQFLEEDAGNLGLILNRLRRDAQLKKQFLEALRALYADINDFDVSIEGGTVQVFFHENRMTIPATRLSDGTLRYLSLLAILLYPAPPPLVCIEEPELGLHPDVLPTLADLLKQAAERMQLIITTHSADLVDELSDTPESVIVCEKHGGSTVMQRQNKDDLQDWLEKYRLGQLWRRGDIGGNRW